MPRKGITGHDEWVITEALATALIALGSFHRSTNRTPKWTISGSFWLRVASLGPSTCILRRQSAGFSPILIERPSIENAASRTDQADRDAGEIIALPLGASGHEES
jgi:hypothetical protein